MLNIQPLYVLVPGQACEVPCAYCLTRQYTINAHSCLDENSPHYTMCKQDFYKRMAFARDIGYNALFLVGDCDPQDNRAFLERIASINNMLARPYRIMELTTSGRNLNREYLYFLRTVVGITTIDLNIASFNDKQNQELGGMSGSNAIELKPLIRSINELRFNLHLHVYMSDYFDRYKDDPEQFFNDCRSTYKADYVSIHAIGPVNSWLQTRRAKRETIESLSEYIANAGTEIGAAISTPYEKVYALGDLIAIADCPNIKNTIPANSLVLQTTGRLYNQWRDRANLIF